MRFSRFVLSEVPSTPALSQWKKIKESVPDHLLFFRVGDFYECFYEDAQSLSSICSITLTRRSGGKNAGFIPMAGVPVHSVDSYISKLLSEGKTVAVADQTETPEEARSLGKKIVSREVTRIVTPGTVLDEELLSYDKPSYLLAVMSGDNGYEVCWTDISAGHSGKKTLREKVRKFLFSSLFILLSSFKKKKE